MTDDDDTERGRRRLSAQDRLMLESVRHKTYVYPASEDEPQPRHDTKPWELIDREELTPREQEVIQRSRRSSSDYATVADLVKVAVRDRSMAKTLEGQTLQRIEEHDKSMDRLRTAVHDLKRDASTAKWIVRGLLAAALTVFLYVADRILTRVEHEGETTIEMQHLKATVEELRQDLRSLYLKGQTPP